MAILDRAPGIPARCDGQGQWRGRTQMRWIWLALAASLSTGAMAQLPEGLRWDDGYTYFTVDSHRGTKDGKPYSEGWMLKTALRIWGNVPKRSGFRVIVEKDGKELANYHGEGALGWTAPPNQAVFVLQHDRLGDRNQIVPVVGEVNVKCYYIDGNDDQEYLGRTYVLDVRKVGKVRGTPSKPTQDAPEWFVNRHSEVLNSVLWLKGRGESCYVASGRMDTWDRNRVEVTLNVSTAEGQQHPRGFIRATVNGERLDLGNDDAIHCDESTSRGYVATFTSRKAEKYHKGPPYKEYINFRQYAVTLPLTWGGEGTWVDPEHLNLSEHPGDWELRWIEEGNTLRIWRFTVKDGMPIPHPEQAAAGLSLHERAYFIETEIPADSVLDERLVPDEIMQGCFSHLGWKSDEGRAMAAKVAAKGKPYPAEE